MPLYICNPNGRCHSMHARSVDIIRTIVQPSLFAPFIRLLVVMLSAVSDCDDLFLYMHRCPKA